MASAPETDYETLGHAVGGSAEADAPRERYVGEHVFICIGWAVIAIFWGASMTIFVGILRAVSQPVHGVAGHADAAAIGYLLMDVVGGLVLLGLVMAFASAMVARRNRRMDPVTEAATADLYDREGARG
jgi:hypothetical protein